MNQRKITDDMQAFVSVLPFHITDALEKLNKSDALLEVVMDLGRVPFARFVDGEVALSTFEVTQEDLDAVVSQLSDFDEDNRAGLERTLHRISAIRNRRGQVVGLTCRVGRAVFGTLDIIQDLVESGKNILLLGRPGIGKTTLLREAARIQAENRRVVIVDTSNEIGGDGDVPHPAVGRARRMQVATPSLQHEVMIEAVENHNPEVIVIDEIGRELEAAAARTIAERGVQLIGTAHGKTLENLMINPTLSDLIGGIESVTLSDEEARRRGTQKTVLERRSPPTFEVLIEIQERDYLAVHHDVASSVDAIVRGHPIPPEIRYRDPNGDIHIRKQIPAVIGGRSQTPAFAGQRPQEKEKKSKEPLRPQPGDYSPNLSKQSLKQVYVYPFGVARNRLEEAIQRLGVPAKLVKDLNDAEALITLRTHYRNRQHAVLEAELRGLPMYILRANTMTQMEKALVEMFNISIEAPPSNWEHIISQTQTAIEAVLDGERWVDLPAASPAVRSMQHEMARQAHLGSQSYGKEPNRRVRIFRD
jgi:stage III sporulation protein SpoIIIAA